MPPQTAGYRYLEVIDMITLTKTDYPQRTLTYSIYGTTLGTGSGRYGTSSSYLPLQTEHRSIYVDLPQDMIDSIENDRNQPYTSTVAGGITFPDQILTISRLHSMMFYKWVYKLIDGSTQSYGTVNLLTSGTHQLIGDSVDVTMKYRPLTRGSTFYYCLSHEFHYSSQIVCQINGRS